MITETFPILIGDEEVATERLLTKGVEQGTMMNGTESVRFIVSRRPSRRHAHAGAARISPRSPAEAPQTLPRSCDMRAPRHEGCSAESLPMFRCPCRVYAHLTFFLPLRDMNVVERVLNKLQMCMSSLDYTGICHFPMFVIWFFVIYPLSCVLHFAFEFLCHTRMISIQRQHI